MTNKSNTSLVPSVAREFGVLLLVVLFASTPFFAAQAREMTISPNAFMLSLLPSQAWAARRSCPHVV